MPSKLLAVGLSHHQAPVELREKLVFSGKEIAHALEHLRSTSDEALLISTCNRTELYVRPEHAELTTDYLIDFLFEEKKLSSDERNTLREHFIKLNYCDAIIHLFEVIAGIDSQIIGDQQIFTQIKDSFKLSEEVGSNGTFMTKFAHAAFRVAKRVRTETQLLVGAGTISYAAVEFARKVYDDLSVRSALIIGAGETAEIAAKHLVERGVEHLYVANRTHENAVTLVNTLSSVPGSKRFTTMTLSEIPNYLPECDIVISSTANENIILSAADIRTALKMRRSASPLVLIDIAVPRDIDPKAADIPNVFLKDIDDLSAIVDQNLEARKAEIPKIKEIITNEFNDFLAVFTKLEVGPTIKELRDKFEQIRQEELTRNKTKFSDAEFSAIDDMTRKIINRLLHNPTVMLKEPRSTKDDMQSRIELIRALFALDEKEKESE
ncbi:MAG TPA: glutamyl-tRNA reductase [Candidatus Kapabacteria bacterium]